ncbi:MAG: ATP-binding protein [Atribacterota bacterium]
MEDGAWCAGSSLGRMALHFLQGVLREHAASSGALAVFEPCQGKLRILASFGLSLSRLRKFPYFAPQGIGMHVFKTGAPVLLDATHVSPFPLGYERKRDVASICLPLRCGDGAFAGVLSLNKSDRPFAHPLSVVLDTTAQKFLPLAEEFSWLWDGEQALWAAEKASRALRNLDWATGIREVARTFLCAFRMLVPTEYAALFAQFPEGESVTVLSRKASSLLSPQVRKEIGRVFAPFFRKKRLLVCNLQEVPGLRHLLPGEVPQEVVVCPFLWHGHFLGAFVALADVPLGRFSQGLLATFGNIASGVLWSFASFKRIRFSLLEREHLRLAQSLHDGVAQGIAGAEMYCQMLKEALWERGVLRQNEALLLHRLEHFLSLCRVETRTMVEALRGRKEGGNDFSLREALLEKLDYLFGLQGVRYALKIRLPEDALAPSVQREIFSILEECCINVWKHAGATRLLVAAGCFHNAVYLLVWDNGRGFTKEEERKEHAFGLRGIRERVASLGGAVRIRSFPGKGTKVGVMFPVFW